jgi:hypothetical protein
MWEQSTVATAVACLIILHRPDGSEVAVDTRQIGYIEAIQTRHQYVHGSRTLLHIGNDRLPVIEEPHEVERLTKICEDGAK